MNELPDRGAVDFRGQRVRVLKWHQSTSAAKRRPTDKPAVPSVATSVKAEPKASQCALVFDSQLAEEQATECHRPQRPGWVCLVWRGGPLT